MRFFYAFEWSYGYGVMWNGEIPAGRLRAFKTKAERDSWVEDGPEYRNERGYRSAESASWVRTLGEDKVRYARLEAEGQVSFD